MQSNLQEEIPEQNGTDIGRRAVCRTLAQSLVLLLLLTFSGCINRVPQPDPHAQALRQKLAEAEAMEKEGKADEAAETYFQIIATEPGSRDTGETVADTARHAEIFPIIINALDALADCSSRVSEPQALAARLQALEERPTDFLRESCLRDLRSTAAYVWFRCDDIPRAGEMIQRALDTPMHRPTDERLFRDYSYAGQIFVSDQSMSHQVTDWLELALQHAAKCAVQPVRTSFVRSLLGTIYNWQGRIDQAFTVLNENYRQAQEENDTVAQIYALNTLSNLYDFWEIYPEANRYSALAVALAESCDKISPLVMGDTYTLKAGAVKNEHPDSVPYYVAKGEEALKNYPYNMGRENFDYIAADYEFNVAHRPDSAKFRLHRYAREAHPFKRHAAYHLLARIYLAENDTERGEQMLDSMYLYSLMVDTIPTESREAMEFALSHYLQTGNRDKAIQYATEISKCAFYGRDKSIRDRLVSAIIEFQGTQAKEKVERLQLEHKARTYWHLAIIALCLAVILLLVFAMMIVKKRNAARHLKSVVQIIKLQEQLDQAIKESESHKQTLALLDDTAQRRTTERISLSLIKEKSETEFRNRFHILYPQFEKRLKALNVKIGPREEMMCMLFILGADSATVAATLFIERNSVNVARYRLRKKFGLEESQSLDDFLAELAKNEDETM